MEKLCKQLEDKLCTLLSFLTQLPAELEMIADEIDNENLKNALCSIAVESNQYANELNAHLRRLEIDPPHVLPANLKEEILQEEILGWNIARGNEVLNICEKSEAFFTRLYTEAMQEYLPNTSLKDMMNYQLMGIKSAFLRVRFLNSLRFKKQLVTN